MKKMIKKQWSKMILAGSFMLMLGAGSAIAAPHADIQSSYQLVAEASDSLTAKQAEIDAFVFGTGAEEIAAQGFSVTHTVVIDGKVEVGITPYDDKSTSYLYDKFGPDSLQVVEGTQAVLLETNAVGDKTEEGDALTEKQLEIDGFVFGTGLEELAVQGFSVTHTVVIDGKVEVGITPFDDKHAAYLYDKFGSDLVQVVEGTQAGLFETTTTTPVVEEDAAQQVNSNLWFMVAAGLIGIIGIVWIATRKKAPRR